MEPVSTTKLPMRAVLIIAGMGGLALVSYLTVARHTPCAISPYSFAVVVPLLAGGGVLAFAIMPILFLLWSLGSLAGHQPLPARSVILLVVFAAGSLMWFATLWSEGVKYHERALIYLWAALSAAFAVGLLAWSRRLRRRPTWLGTIAFHWVLFAWPTWCGFPWLGVVP